jgi:hypothetical protein
LQAGGHRFDPDWLHQTCRTETYSFTTWPLRLGLLFKNPDVLFLTLSFQAKEMKDESIIEIS